MEPCYDLVIIRRIEWERVRKDSSVRQVRCCSQDNMAFGLYPAITEGSAAYKLHYIYTHYHYSATRSTCNFEDKDTPSGRQRALIIIHLQDIFRKIISRCPLERLPAAGAPPRKGPRELPAMCSLCSIRIRFRSSKKPST